MRTCEYAGVAFAPRAHPWTDAAGDPDGRYYDFTAHPDLIRTALEDFQPWSAHAAIETFYRLLEKINQHGSLLESNDCAFTGPQENDQPAWPQALQCSGRVMVLFRDLKQNTADGRVEALAVQLHHALAHLDPDFPTGLIGTTLIPVRYLQFPDGNQQLGWQLMISFWAWGDTVAETMANLDRLFANLSRALESVSRREAHP